MKIRRYTCKDMQEALLKVKMDLGSEAVIMNSRKVKPKGLFGLFQKPMLEVVAAVDDDYARPARPNLQQRQNPVYSNLQQPQQQPLKTPQTPYQEYPQQPYMQETPNPYPQTQTYTPPPVYPQATVAYEQQVYPKKEPRIQQERAESSPGIGVKAPEVRQREAVPTPEKQMITELGNKVKQMESMLNQIYQVVQGKEKTEKEEEVNAQAPTQVLTQAPTQMPAKAKRLESEHLAELGQLLMDRDVEPKLIDKILDKIRERGGASLNEDEVFDLAARVMTVLLGEPEPLVIKEDKKPHVAIFIGPTGVGKTTTLAKIAADFTLNKQKKVGLITADTYRIAAVEQLKTYAEILNLQVHVVYSPNEMKDAVERLSDNDLILIDTAGRSHKNKAHFNELKSLLSAVNADETYLVMSCNTGRGAAKEILEYYAFVKKYKLLFTKLDESPVPGIILNARYLTGKPLSYTTAGQSVPDDLDVANIKQLVNSILAKPVN